MRYVVLKVFALWFLLGQAAVSQQVSENSTNTPDTKNKTGLELEDGQLVNLTKPNATKPGKAFGGQTKTLSVTEEPQYVMGLFATILQLALDELSDLFCSAVAISQNYLLAPAACVYPYHAVPYSIVACNFLGCRIIESIIIHPEYNRYTNENNIAILQIYSKLGLLPGAVVCLPLPFVNLDHTTSHLIETYDLLSPQDESVKNDNTVQNKKYSNKQRWSKRYAEDEAEERYRPFNYSVVKTVTIPNKDCCQHYKNQRVTITSNMMCAEPVSKQNYCDDDGGSALIIECERKPVVVGLQSYCASNSMPKIFTRISQYFYWIQKYVNYGACALRCALPYYDVTDPNYRGSYSCNDHKTYNGQFYGYSAPNAYGNNYLRYNGYNRGNYYNPNYHANKSHKVSGNSYKPNGYNRVVYNKIG